MRSMVSVLHTPPPTPRMTFRTLRSDTKRNRAAEATKGGDYDDDDSTAAWACDESGKCGLFPWMKKANIEVVTLTRKHRLFRYVQRQTTNRPDHVITWGEEKGHGMIVWSTFPAKSSHPRRKAATHRFIVPTAGNINLPARNKVAKCIDDAAGNTHSKVRALGYSKVNKVHDKLNQVMWHIVTPKQERKHFALDEASAVA